MHKGKIEGLSVNRKESLRKSEIRNPKSEKGESRITRVRVEKL